MYNIPLPQREITNKKEFLVDEFGWRMHAMIQDYKKNNNKYIIPPGAVFKALKSTNQGYVKLGLFKSHNPGNIGSYRFEIPIQDFNNAEFEDYP